ncbi:4'-phosphopantetheinyl transferase superfamily protein [Clostridium sp. BNL1100]|uniref:4'-phosphopantetheinyl transferase family protein n=1 Tax=Clostridium sp. BNL1100 TaxID=755731 RepID=UPI00024A7CF9|nr:4'-phosphopantetheinyl transferase superfamily protein [Clostridium sp. BNL1100]AEY67071.1 hypothetical protein Clo1100_2919 [Clostridium sp. BNL1100]
MKSKTKIYYMSFKSLNKSNLKQLKQNEKKYMRILYEYAFKDYSRDSMENDLQDMPTGRTEHISKSHSYGYVVIGISPQPIGCDIEKVRTDWTREDLKKRISFYLGSDSQLEVLNSLNPQRSAIIAWTRKESYFKVHQTRCVSKEFEIASLNETVCGKHMKFVSIQVDKDMILTCYIDIKSDVEWIQLRV